MIGEVFYVKLFFEWGDEMNICWKICIVGIGSLMLIIWGDKVFVLMVIEID